jgi:hypothetical protein
MSLREVLQNKMQSGHRYLGPLCSKWTQCAQIPPPCPSSAGKKRRDQPNNEMAEITYGAAGSPIKSDEESDIIEANVAENEMNDCNFAYEIHLCEHC